MECSELEMEKIPLEPLYKEILGGKIVLFWTRHFLQYVVMVVVNMEE